MQSPASVPDAVEAQAILTAPLRVLVVEDSATARVLLRQQFRRLAPSAELWEAEDGKAALRLLGTRIADLIVCDLHMPGMDGASFVQLLRRNSLLRAKPVLVATGSPQDAGAELLGDPRVRLLAKPVQAAGLYRALRELLG
jgi:CheY-like chemotaxis protein